MTVPVKYRVGDVVRLKKPHPCGGDLWSVMRTGIDFRVRCLKCDRVLMLARPQFERSVRQLVSQAEEES
ncbi:MAG TPA: DUF951 domain-containing protein [Spirochaetia bacterium]|nr:DUF951 domain-containing protein [Spirochaetia bacterium]